MTHDGEDAGLNWFTNAWGQIKANLKECFTHSALLGFGVIASFIFFIHAGAVMLGGGNYALSFFIFLFMFYSWSRITEAKPND